jgi:MGT family glycosyltransferase
MHIAVITIGATGHVNASLPFVGELVRRGASVTYFATEDFEKAVAHTGARFVAFDSDLNKPGVDIAKDMIAEVPLRFLSEADHVIRQILPVLEKDRPDAIVYDTLALAGRLAVAALEVPAIQIYTSYASNAGFSPARQFPAYPDTHPARAAAKTLAEDLSRRYGVPHWDIFEIFEGAEKFNLVLLLKAFQPAGDLFDDRYVFTGAQIAPRDNAGTWKAPDDGRPLVFASLGTLFNEWPEFFHMLFAAVEDLPVTVVAATGRKLDVATLGPVPANVSLAPYLPQLDILEKADLFVTHAGTGSVMEALHFGVPMVAIPQMPEQGITARRIVEVGLGKAFLDKSELSAEALREAIVEVLGDPSYKKAGEFMKAEMARSGGYTKTAETILSYFEKQLA